MLGRRMRFDDHPTRAVFDTEEISSDSTRTVYRVYLRSWQRHSCRLNAENTPMFDAVCPKEWCRWIAHVSILQYLDGIGRLGWPEAGGIVWRHRTIEPYAYYRSIGSRVPVVDFCEGILG